MIPPFYLINKHKAVRRIQQAPTNQIGQFRALVDGTLPAVRCLMVREGFEVHDLQQRVQRDGVPYVSVWFSYPDFSPVAIEARVTGGDHDPAA